MTSYVRDGTVGPWAAEKLKCLQKYLHAYTTILRKFGFDGYVYIDAFAGAGKAKLREYKKPEFGLLLEQEEGIVDDKEVADYIYGSPRVALELQHPFTEYVFIEKNPQKVKELLELKDEYQNRRKITILQGDANEEIERILKEFNWRKYRAVAFLDPFGMQVPWSTIEAIGKTNAIEIILNFPVGMSIQRNLPRSGEFSEEKKKFLETFFGSSEWEDAVYEDKGTPDLFGVQIKDKKDGSGEELAKWYQQRLGKVFGYAPPPRLITNTKGTHLYYLIFAGPNPTGAKIADHVLNQGKRII